MSFRINFLTTISILLVYPSIECRGGSLPKDDASWKERFLAEAPRAWEKYCARAKRFQGIIERTTIRLAPKREVMDKNWCEIKQRDGCALFLAQYLGFGNPPDKRGLLLGINPHYGFELLRLSQAAPWLVKNQDIDLSDGIIYTLASPPSEAVAYWTNCPTNFDLIPSFAWSGIQDPGFGIKRVENAMQTGEQVVKVEFNYRAPTDKPKIPSLKGWVRYNTQNYWIIQEYNLQVEWISAGVKASTVVTYEYEKSTDGFPIPKCVIRRFTPVGGVDRESRFDFHLKEADVPESDFMLTAFDLPEPAAIHPPTRWYLWVALAGILCLGGAALFRRLARRGENRIQKPTPPEEA